MNSADDSENLCLIFERELKPETTQNDRFPKILNTK